jgi:hypothetical protein
VLAKPKSISAMSGVFCLVQVDNTVWAGLADKSIKIFDLEGQILKTISHAHQGGVTCLLVVGDEVWSGSMDRNIRRWNQVIILFIDILNDLLEIAETTATVCQTQRICIVFSEELERKESDKWRCRRFSAAMVTLRYGEYINKIYSKCYID